MAYFAGFSVLRFSSTFWSTYFQVARITRVRLVNWSCIADLFSCCGVFAAVVVIDLLHLLRYSSFNVFWVCADYEVPYLDAFAAAIELCVGF